MAELQIHYRRSWMQMQISRSLTDITVIYYLKDVYGEEKEREVDARKTERRTYPKKKSCLRLGCT